ncbi:unnamed protein product [Orchesella dallaii]|uniref:C2H2-type domain-containing protein n=1 Tax=Orchesella dallaii TaxID=48710 RepID=A0ABP1RTX0_9HEXA
MPRIPAKVFKCTKCVKTYKFKSCLIRHQNYCHISKPTVYTCTTCKKTFNRLEYLEIHVKYVHQKIKNYRCVFCEKQFGTKDKLDRHILSHTGEKHFWCDKCVKELSTIKGLEIHRKQHNEEKTHKDYRCEICSKAFEYNHKLIRHLLTHNPLRPRPHNCTICQKDFTTFQNLQQHSQAVHQKIKEYSCVFCEKQCGRLGDLNSHIMWHIGEKPFLCDTCDMEFANLRGLKNHKRLHTKQNLFKCNQCSKAYTTLKKLEVHKLNHFKLSLSKNQSNFNLESHILKHVKEKPFLCSECGEEFKSKNVFTLHLKRGQCSKKKVISTKPFPSRANTTETEKTDGEDGVDAMNEDLAQEEIENHLEISIPNVCLPGEEESRTFPLNAAPVAVPEANIVRETTKRPEVRVCGVCGEQFRGEKLDKDYGMHIIAKKHYLWKF